MHELLRSISMKAWSDVQEGKTNLMAERLMKNKQLRRYLSAEEIKKLLEVRHHIGNAPERTNILVKEIHGVINKNEE